MATITKPMALDESFNTTEVNSRNQADVLVGIENAIREGFGQVASGIEYDNTESSITATNVQDAIDEVDGIVDGIESDIQGTQSVSGNPLTVTDAAPIYAEEVDVAVECTQTGSGTPSPSNIRPIQGYDIVSVDRCGKNLFDKDSSEIVASSYLFDDGSIGTPASNWIISGWCPIIGGYPLTLYNQGSAAAPAICWYDLNKNFIGGQAYNGVSSAITVTPPKYAAYVRFSCHKDYVNTAQLEIGSQATTYTAFTGNDKVNIQLGNKNLLPMTVEGIKAANSTLTWNGNSATRNGITYTILTDENGLVTGINANGTANAESTLSLANCPSDGKQYILNGSTGGSNNTYSVRVSSYGGTGDGDFSFTPTSANNVYIQVINGQSLTNKKFYPMVRDASVTDPTFSPYNPTLGGMIYGGQLTLKDDGSAVFVGDKAFVEYDGSSDENWSKAGVTSASAFLMAILLPYDIKSVTGSVVFPIITNYLVATTQNAAWGNLDYFVASNNVKSLYTGIQSITTVEAWKTYLASNPLQVVYTLATPFTMHLSAEQLKLLQGTNNVWSNAGNVTLKYQPDNVIAEPKADVQRLRDYVDDRLVGNASKNIFDMSGFLNADGWVKNADGSYTGQRAKIYYNVYNATENNLHGKVGTLFKKGENLTATFTVYGDTKPRIYFGFNIRNSVNATERNVELDDIDNGTYTLTTNCSNDEFVCSIWFTYSGTGNITFKNFQIERGTTPTAYEEYYPSNRELWEMIKALQ